VPPARPTNLAKMDVDFKRSQRRAETRRSKWRPPRLARGHVVLIGLLSLLLVGGVFTGLTTISPIAGVAPATTPAPVTRCPLPSELRPGFEAAAERTGVPLALLVAIAEVESNLDPAARSSAGAQGLLQLMPATAREVRVDALHAPSNVLGGARYVRRMLQRFGRRDLAIAAYHSGPSTVQQAGLTLPAASVAHVAKVEAKLAQRSGCR